MTGRGAMPVCRRALALTVALLCSGAAGIAAGKPPTDTARALEAVAELRRHMDPAPAPTEDSFLALSWRGRPALEIKGRTAGGEAAGRLRDFSLFDLGNGRIISFVWFPHASTRRAGEAIISLSEVSTRADAHLRALFPGAALTLEGIERYRASGQDAVYYKASFAAPTEEVPFLQPPVRLLLDASSGNLFRFDVEPEWLSPPRLPGARLSRKAAERIAAATLRSRDLARGLGAGAALGKVATAELFVVRPNDWLDDGNERPEPQARVAWVVPFSLAGEGARAAHRLFVDAATGRVLGGLPAPAMAPVPPAAPAIH